MAEMIEVIPSGTVTSPKGFTAGATYAGLKTYSPDKLDLGLLVSEKPSIATGVFTTNKVVSPSVTLSKTHIKSGEAQAIVANSGCANTCVGDQGLKDAQEVVELAARHLNMTPEQYMEMYKAAMGTIEKVASIEAAQITTTNNTTVTTGTTSNLTRSDTQEEKIDDSISETNSKTESTDDSISETKSEDESNSESN